MRGILRWGLVGWILALGSMPVFGNSLDFGIGHTGLSLGNSPYWTGLRLNAVDAEVRRIDGVNLTLWNPLPNPDAEFNGLALGLIGTKARCLHGLAIGGIGTTARERIDGIGLAGFGVGTQRLRGLAAGGILTRVEESCLGIAISPLVTNVTGVTRGATLAGIFARSDTTSGLVAGGLLAFGRQHDGVVFSFGVAGTGGRLRGLSSGLLTSGAQNAQGIMASGICTFTGEDATGILAGGACALAGRKLRGIALSLGVAGAGRQLDGIAIGGLGAGSGDRIRGLAAGSLVVMAPDVTGISIGALNGVILEEINLEDFLKIRTVNRKHRGLAIGLVNYSADLQGVQIGLFNIAGNNRKWLRILPLINCHF